MHALYQKILPLSEFTYALLRWSSAQVSLFVVLRLIVETVDDAVQVLEGVNSVLEYFVGLWLLINDHTVPTLIKGAIDDFVEDHLTQLLQDAVHGQPDALGDVIDLNFRIRLNNLLQVIL